MRKKTETDVAPLEAKQYALPFALEERCGIYAITVSFVLREDTAWAGAGGITSYRYAQKELFETIPRPNFWRAPVDNDEGDWMMQRYGQWKLASLYATNREVAELPYRPMSVEETGHSVKIRQTLNLPTVPAASCELCYEVFADGTIQIKMSYDPIKGLSDMPEFGMMWKLDADYENVSWFGIGPQETYADRTEGARLGIYHNKVEANFAQYLNPQECGYKAKVYWAKITDQKGRGIKIWGDKIGVSALPYTPHEIENARHSYELPQIHYTVLRVAGAQMGVGGDDSWGAHVHPEFLIDSQKKQSFCFSIKGI